MEKLHLLGLLSDGGVHSHEEHLYALVDMAAEKGLSSERILIHAFMDGRDTPPSSGSGYIRKLEREIKGKARIATVSGRYYAMDRDKNWDRVIKAWSAMVDGEAPVFSSAGEAMEQSYAAEINDEFVIPVVIGSSSIDDGDSIIFFNFRADRARQMTRVFIDSAFDGFPKKKNPKVHYVCMTQYDETFDTPIAYPAEPLVNILGDVLAQNNKTQLRIAETRKICSCDLFLQWW